MMKHIYKTFAASFTICFTLVAFAAHAQTWSPIGSPGFSAGNAAYTTMVVDNSTGTPYVAYIDVANGQRITVMKYNGSSWVPVGGAGFSQGEVRYPSIAIYNGTPYVAYQDLSFSGAGTVMAYIDGSWVTIGSPGFTGGEATFTSIAIDGSGNPYVAFGQGEEVQVMEYVLGAWTTTGYLGYAGSVSYVSMAIDGSGTQYVVFQDAEYSNAATVMEYTSGTWTVIGPEGFSGGPSPYTSIAIDGSGIPYVLFKDQDNGNSATVMKYNSGSGSWEAVGSRGFTGAVVTWPSMVLSGGNIYVAYSDYSSAAGGNGNATVMEYNGTDWVTVGSAGFAAGEAVHTSIAIGSGGVPYVVYEDSVNGYKATVMKYDTSSGIKNITNATTSITTFPNPSHGVFTLTISTPTQEQATITITNMLGEKVKELTAPTNTDTALYLDVPPGIYFVTAITMQGKQSMKLEIW